MRGVTYIYKFYRKIFYFALRGLCRYGDIDEVGALLRVNANVIYFRSDEFFMHLLGVQEPSEPRGGSFFAKLRRREQKRNTTGTKNPLAGSSRDGT